MQAASTFVEALAALSPHISARTRLEALAYLSIIRASGFFDRQKHSEALQANCVARKLLTFLAQHSSSAKDEAFANSFLDGGEAQIRFSAYQLGLEEQDLGLIEAAAADEEVCEKWAPGYEALMKQVAAETKGSDTSKGDNEINWRGTTIKIRNPELLDAYHTSKKEQAELEKALSQEQADPAKNPVRAKKNATTSQPRYKHSERNARRKAGITRTFRGSSSKTGMDPFDRALQAATDAEALAAELVEDNAAALAKSHSSRYQAVNNELRSTHDYLLFSLLSLRIRRNDHLAKEVERKAERREKRARETMEAKIANPDRRPKLWKKTRKVKVPEKKPVRRQRKSQKKPAKAASEKSSKKSRGGTKRFRREQRLHRSQELRQMAEEKSKRRRARAVPALARLLDAAEASLRTLAGLNLVEQDADLSSLIDAKIAWYRAELLRQLAKAYSLSKAYPHAVMLLQRAQLFIRQARSALELAEHIEREDADLPPSVTEEALKEKEVQLAAELKATQKEMFKEMRSGHGSNTQQTAQSHLKGDAMGESNAAVALRELASKHVVFDEGSLEQAKRVPADVLREVQSSSANARQTTAAPTAPKSTEAEDFEEAEAFQEADEGDFEGSGDEHFEDPETEEGEGEQGDEQKKGWFGGWLRR